jgi:hypothetical protein
MDWLRKLLGRKQVNPEEYERVTCDVCDGTGRLLLSRKARDFTPTGNFRNLHCPVCHGRGWRPVRKPDEQPTERQATRRPPDGETVGRPEAVASEDAAVVSAFEANAAAAVPDVPSAPTPPSAPPGMP